MRLFREPLLQLSEYENIRKNLQEKECPVGVEGCVDAQKTHWMASFSGDYPVKLIITHSEKRVKEIYEDYRFFAITRSAVEYIGGPHHEGNENVARYVEQVFV